MEIGLRPHSGSHTGQYVESRVGPPLSRVEPVAPPPEGGLPGAQVLTQLTPVDRMAIAGLTGYHLSATGTVLNPGGVPPWSFIVAFATHVTQRSAEPVGDGHVDVRV